MGIQDRTARLCKTFSIWSRLIFQIEQNKPRTIFFFQGNFGYFECVLHNRKKHGILQHQTSVERNFSLSRHEEKLEINMHVFTLSYYVWKIITAKIIRNWWQGCHTCDTKTMTILIGTSWRGQIQGGQLRV